ncbi:hypothetical protein GCM10007872_21670 [Gluconobacter sphaericus NBRC 12467]|uniref:Uncharacterized protein n=1 Tax=Gluconobacter sphaericus NBRC 12467 TaxID=1307951 RepID=A0AA37SKV4_9PROT|nr:hypothetical protein GCM10007872_21670 [Gluconobacter sphaericus NBRC 12467]
MNIFDHRVGRNCKFLAVGAAHQSAVIPKIETFRAGERSEVTGDEAELAYSRYFGP